MIRLEPGAPAATGSTWYYCRPGMDFVSTPVIVRSRFKKLVEEGYFKEVHATRTRALYEILRSTSNVDDQIHRYWQPRVIMQAKTDWDGDQKGDLIFYDYSKKEILVGDERIALPSRLDGGYSPLLVGSFPGDGRVDFVAAHLADTFYWRGARLAELTQTNDYYWNYYDSGRGRWKPEYPRWYWDLDIPMVVDIDGDGFDSHIIHRPGSGEWIEARSIARASFPTASHSTTRSRNAASDPDSGWPAT